MEIQAAAPKVIMYRQQAKQDTYVIDQRPIIKREFKMPSFNLPSWLPSVSLFIASPFMVGTSMHYLHGTMAQGAAVSLSLLGVVSMIRAIYIADKIK